MFVYKLIIKLLNDTTFGRGDGVAGLVDHEIEHDPNGFPYLRGRTLKGLLSEECDNLIAVLSPESVRQHWQKVACKLFGKPGSTLETESQMNVGDACLPLKLRQAVANQMKQRNNKLTRVDILESLTAIRRQTAIDPTTGTADEKSLRSSRVILRELEFTADLSFVEKPSDDTTTLLSVGTLALRRMGSGRHRGRGHVQCRLFDPDSYEVKYEDYLVEFSQLLEVSK